jgi:hypothetical protein
MPGEMQESFVIVAARPPRQLEAGVPFLERDLHAREGIGHVA